MSDPILNDSGMTELLLAAYHGDFEWMLNCIKNGNDIHACSPGGMTPLHWVVDMGVVGDSDQREAIVRHLIALGATINAVDSSGESVLFRAVLAGNTRLMQILIDAGADVNQADEKGVKPLHTAMYNDHAEAIDLLKRAGAVN